MQPKTLILIRHAHRHHEIHSRDNGLSEKGEEQVKKLLPFALKRLTSRDFENHRGGTSPLLLTSPKKRCQETIAPLAKALHGRLIIDERLGEGQAGESALQYETRLNKFIDYWKDEAPALTLLCSHGDWIPMAVERLTQAKIQIKKAGWIEIQANANSCHLTWLVQKIL